MITLLEPIEVINKRLIDYFGKFENGEANWRVVWSDDQTEKRLTEFTDEGFQLLTPVVREVKKYGYIKERYILERLIPVPPSAVELTTKISYEPVWTFENMRTGEPLPPKWEVIQVFVTTVIENMVNAAPGFAKYKMPEELHNTREAIEERVKKMQELMFGNETAIGDALSNGNAVGFGEEKKVSWIN